MSKLILLAFMGCFQSDAEEHEDHDGHGHEEEGEHQGEGHGEEVHLSPEAVKAARLVVAEATAGSLAPEIILPARVTLDPRKEAIVSVWIGGQVGAIKVRAGDVVKKNQTLATVQSPDLGERIAAYRSSKARDEAADARLERLHRLQEAGVASRSQVLEAEADHAEAAGDLEAAEERLRILGVNPTTGDPHAGGHYASHVPVKSPIAGRVLAAKASVGKRVEPGDVLFHVGDLNEVWLLMDVYERDLASVKPGQSVHFKVPAYPGERFLGTVEQVGDLVEVNTRTVEVRVVVQNKDAKLKPNMFATATLTTSGVSENSGVVVAAGALQMVGGKPVIFVEEEPGEYQARHVTVVEQSSAQVLVSDGVTAGESVVIDGAFALKSELEKSELGEGHAH